MEKMSRKEDAIRVRKYIENRKMSFGFSLKELHDFPSPEQRARFNKKFVKIMEKYKGGENERRRY